MTAGKGWPRCAEVSAAAGDPGEGTAPPASHWFLLEHPGPWGRHALSGSGIDPTAVSALSAWCRRDEGRVVLVREPGRAADRTGPRRWFRIDSRPGHEAVRRGTFDTERALADVIDDPDAGEPLGGGLFLACTHGRHDTCCAVFGRPLAAALAAMEPGRAFECTHVGGCRFAPAMVVLPHGYVYGRVPVLEGTGLAHDYAKGRLRPRYLRGRSSLEPAAQAAQHHARIATGADGVDALRPVEVGQLDDGHWRVVLRAPDCTVELRERRVAAGRPLTCAATAPGWLRMFDLVGLTVRP